MSQRRINVARDAWASEVWFVKGGAIVRTRNHDEALTKENPGEICVVKPSDREPDEADIVRLKLAAAAPQLVRMLLSLGAGAEARCRVCYRYYANHSTGCGLAATLSQAGVPMGYEPDGR
jgi:hypothetical protein